MQRCPYKQACVHLRVSLFHVQSYTAERSPYAEIHSWDTQSATRRKVLRQKANTMKQKSVEHIWVRSTKNSKRNITETKVQMSISMRSLILNSAQPRTREHETKHDATTASDRNVSFLKQPRHRARLLILNSIIHQLRDSDYR